MLIPIGLFGTLLSNNLARFAELEGINFWNVLQYDNETFSFVLKVSRILIPHTVY